MTGKSLIIGYDLRRPGQNYDSLIKQIKELGSWWHGLDSTWIIKTNQTATQIRDVLRQHIDSNDRLLVAELTGNAAWTGSMSDTAAKWLREDLNR